MSTQTPSIIYESAKRILAVACGPPRRKFLLPSSSPIQFAAYSFDQEFEMLLSSFPPAQKNVASSSGPFAGLLDANAILTSLSQPTPTGGGKGKFTASFSIVPASWDDYQTQIVNFPGWSNVIGTNFRDPKPTEVNVRLHYDYFVVGNVDAGILDSSGAVIKTAAAKGAIPILRRTPWLATYNGAVLLNDEAKALTPAAGVQGYLPTLPTIEQYQAWCAIAATFYASGTAWDETHPPKWDGASSTDVLSGQFRLANSRLVDYAGNIVARVTTYALVE